MEMEEEWVGTGLEGGGERMGREEGREAVTVMQNKYVNEEFRKGQIQIHT